MRKRVHITLSEAVIEKAGAHLSRPWSFSRVVERALWEYILREQGVRDVRDGAILNTWVDYFAREAEDVLRYAAPITFEPDE